MLMLWSERPDWVLRRGQGLLGGAPCEKSGHEATSQDELDLDMVSVHSHECGQGSLLRRSRSLKAGQGTPTKLSRSLSQSFHVADSAKQHTPSLSSCSSRTTMRAAASPSRRSMSSSPDSSASPPNASSDEHRAVPSLDDAETEAEATVRSITLGVCALADAARALIHDLPPGVWAGSTWTERLAILQEGACTDSPPASHDRMSVARGTDQPTSSCLQEDGLWRQAGREKMIRSGSQKSLMQALERTRENLSMRFSSENSAYEDLDTGTATHTPATGFEMCRHMDLGIDMHELRGDGEKLDTSIVKSIHADLMSGCWEDSSDTQDPDEKAAAEQLHPTRPQKSLGRGLMPEELSMLDTIMKNLSLLEEEVCALSASVGMAPGEEGYTDDFEDGSTEGTFMEGRHLAVSGRDVAAGAHALDGGVHTRGLAGMKKTEKELGRREKDRDTALLRNEKSEAMLNQQAERLLQLERRMDEAAQQQGDLQNYCKRLEYTNGQLSLMVRAEWVMVACGCCEGAWRHLDARTDTRIAPS